MATPTPVECAVPGTGLVLRGVRHAFGGPAAEDGGGRWIFLHGWLDNAASFERLAPLLASDPSFADVVLLDLAGHGLSDHRNAAYHVVDYAAEAVAVADVLFGRARFNVAGHSLGGGVALLVAGAWPERIARVAALESVGVLSAPAADAPALLRAACRRAPSGRLTEHASVEAAASARARKNVVPDDAFGEAEARVLAAGTARGEGVVWRADPGCSSPRGSGSRATRARVRQGGAGARAAPRRAGRHVPAARRLDPFVARGLGAAAAAALLRAAAAAAAAANGGRAPAALRRARDAARLVADLAGPAPRRPSRGSSARPPSTSRSRPPSRASSRAGPRRRGGPGRSDERSLQGGGRRRLART
ncbi:hypothetical protein JL722_1257 [Aureococcus anophagefferens]|nr:hypothetical protein JL722_1257 [Aureococcus anophagefferens]